MNIKRYLLIASAMLVVDWVLGALQAAHIIPLWSFLVFNFPFGLPFVWLESHWAGTRYSLGEGQSISETWSFVALFFSVFAQAWLYAFPFGHWGNKRHDEKHA
jgi:hypothetical protein